MATITYDERRLIDETFQMQQGFVLDFSNRTFGEFMKDVVSYDVFKKYPGCSKAKIIRAFLDDESDVYVGKLIAKLVKYMHDYGFVTDTNQHQVEKLSEFAAQKLGRIKKARMKPKESQTMIVNPIIDYDSLKSELIGIHQIQSKQKRGYAFEKFINNMFSAFGLTPRASYRAGNDQLDGSFILDGSTVLIEAKYKEDTIPKDDLILFSTKLSSKSHFSKGLFITYSSVNENAIEQYNNHSSRFVIMMVEELYCICEYRISLKDVLRKKFRALDEEGTIFKHYSKL